ncbi:uncharacterized protein LOC133890527 isoform X2 [Phragmites australis]|uniref:uncharacterized protein LOC133890527 isoform X2 n=1 Tax=Phragmites australis TaxID=29695 RepID=UPI002D79D1D0|nr:uncharacterized protein LOC133890527 isoform X2 [Phragmites australis]
MPSDDVLLLVHQLPVDMEEPHEGRLAHILPPLHRAPPPPPFRPPPPPQAAASAEPRLSFRGWLGAPRHWDLWVAKLRPLHARLWRRLGIHDAVLASTYRFKRDAPAVLHLASFWSPATSTFVFPWAEATLTLQDVALLAGFPARGAPILAPLPPEWRPDEAALNGVRLGFNRSACKKAHHSAWVKHFLTDHTNDAVLEHAAFLALWLTRFVIPGHPESTMRQAVFPIAVRLARGQGVALAPAVLASLYRDLRDIKAFLVAAGAAATTANADMLSSSLSLYAPLYILQLWMWERFPALRPGRANPVRDGEPMTARWHDLSRKLSPTLIREALSSGDNFVWQPYATSVKKHTGWVRSSDLAGNDELGSLAHCLRPCELVGMDCIEQYLPHRVARQFGLDQDVPGDVCRANQDWVVAWQTYELEGKNVAFFIPHSEPGITARYAQWWRQQLPHADIDAGAASIPLEWKTSKRKVKRTPAAMEADAEKERKMKKVRVSPSDKKRKLEELYDAKLSDWLATARNGISDAAGGSSKRGSLPKFDTGSDEALLPNIQNSNDDVVLLMPRKQTTTPAVMVLKDNDMNPALGERGNFIVDKPLDIPSEPERGVTETLEEEILNIPVDRSLDTTDRPEEGATAVMELQKEASGVSDRSEEVTAPVIEEIVEKVAIDGVICVTEMGPSEKDIAIVMEAHEGNVVSEEVGRAAEEAIEAVPQSQQEVDAGVMNISHDAVALPEEELPIQHTNNGGGCSEVSCIMEDSNVVGGLATNDGQTTGCDFVIEEEREVPCVEEIGGGENNQMVEKDREEKPQEAPQIETVECVQDTILMGTDNDGEQKIVHPTVEEAATSNTMAPALLGVPEAENAEVNKDFNLAKKDADDMPMEVAEGKEPEQEQINTLAKGGAEEVHEQFSEVDHTDMADPRMHSCFTTEKPEKAAEVEREEIDGTTRLTGRDTDEKLGDVPGVGHAEVENVGGLIVNAGDENLAEVSQVEPAKVEDMNGLMKEDTNNKSEDVPESENTGSEGTHGPMEDTDGRLKEIHDVNAELEKANGHESDSDRPEGILEVDLLTRDEAKWPAKEEIGDNTTEVPQVKYEKLTDEAPIEEIHDVNAELEKANGRESDSDRPEGILEVDLLTRDEARWLVKEEIGDNTTEVPQVKYEKLTDEAPIEEDTKEKPCADGKDRPEKEVDVFKEVDNLKQAEGEGCKVLIEKDEENINDALDKDVVEDSKNSTNAEMPCSSATEQLKGDQIEVSHEGLMEEQCIHNVELINQREPSSDAAAMKTEGVYDHGTLYMHEEAALKQKQDHIIICENRETTILEGSHMLDTGVKSGLVSLEVDETHVTGGIQNQEILEVDKQLAMEGRQDLGTTIENRKMSMLEDADILVCDEHQINPTGTDVNEVESTKGIQNQELLDNKEQQAMEEKQDLGTTIENYKMNMPEDADILACVEYQIDPTGTEVNEIESTKGIQNQELLDYKEDQVMEKGMECEITDGSGISLEEANKLGGGGGVDTVAVAVDASDSMQNKEACSMEEARENKQHNGVEHANEKRILEDTSMIDSGESKSNATVLEVNMAGSREGTLNQCVLSVEKEAAAQEKQDQGMADENINIDLADIDALECGGVKPDAAVKMSNETLLKGQAVNIAGFKISFENKQKEAPFEEHNITEVEGSESNQTARKEPEGALRPEHESLVEVKQENLENETEMSICRENDEASRRDQTSAEVIIVPSDMDERGENDIGWAEESTKSYGKLASDSINTACHHSIRFGKSSNEEARRTQNSRSMYLKDIKESLGRIRAEPANRAQTTSVGYYSRHAVQEPISVCKDIKVPLRDSARDFGRDRAPELVVTSPQEETSRWRQEQYALQIFEDVQNARVAEKTRMEMEIRILKAQIASMERQVMNLDHFSEVKSRSKRH